MALAGLIISLLAQISTPEAALATALHNRMLVPSSVEHGRPYAWRHCRTAPHGCRKRIETFAGYFVAHAEAYGLDPVLLAAMAYRESRLNPLAVGRGGERGILQVHPARGEARWLDIFEPRSKCAKKLGACQGQVVKVAAGILSRSLKECGDLPRALGMYNSGRCRDNRYSRRVLRTYRKLRAEVEESA